MKKNEIPEILCSLARALAEVSDTWKLLIIKELFWHNHRFDGIRCQTGMSSNSLATRLKEMERDGIVEKTKYESRPPRHEYHLTEKGLELWPALATLTQWGDTWCNSDPKQVLTMSHRGCRPDSHPELVCSDCGEPMHARVSKIGATPEVMADRVSRGSGATE
jgi:DNA-binding HxlR family transcriptional regulator